MCKTSCGIFGKDNLPIIIIAGRARLSVHVGHVEGRAVPVEGGQAGAAGPPAAQLARRARVPRARRALARLQPVRQADGARALLGDGHYNFTLALSSAYIR